MRQAVISTHHVIHVPKSQLHVHTLYNTAKYWAQNFPSPTMYMYNYVMRIHFSLLQTIAGVGAFQWQ